MSEVTDLITALRAGSMTLDEVAQRFRDRSWPRRKKHPRASYLDLAAAAQDDPDPFLPGSFDEVSAAHQQGELSDEEYETLSKAVADSKRAEDRRGER